MYGRPPHFHHGGSGVPPPPPHPQQPPFQQQPPGQQFPLHNYLHNPNNLLYQNPNLLILNNLVNNINNVPIQPQNPNFHFQNVNFQSQNLNAQLPRFPQPQPHRPQEPKPQPQPQPQAQAQAKAMPTKVNINEALERLDRAVIKARHNILASGGNVSAWKVSQDALLALKADSWESLGFQMQQVPSLHRLMAIEAKINSFIHCYVGVRKVTTLYDLELAICKNEGVGLFEELELGPLVRHPLVIHYFSVSPDVKEVFRITSEDIISYLHEYLKTHQGKEVKVEVLLDFIAEKQSKTSREMLHVRIQSLGWHITLIRKAVQSENAILKEHVDELKNKYGIRIRKRPLLSSKKGVLDDRFNEISARMKSLSSMEKIFCGKHVRFSSSSSDNDSSDDDKEDNEDKNDNFSDFEDNQQLKNVKGDANFTSLKLENSERVSRCPYPSASEEMARLGLKPDLECSAGDDTEDETNGMNNVLLTRKRKSSKGSSNILLPRKLHKREKDKSNFHTGDEKKKSGSKDTSDSSLVNDSTRMFVTTWKETCQNNSADEVLDRMLHLYSSRKKKKLTALFSSYPFAGLLDVAVKSIKCGMWDSIYDTFQTLGQQGALNSVSEKQVDCISIDVESDEEDAPISAGKSSKHECGVTVDDIIKKISSYFDFDGDVSGYANPTKEMRLSILRKLYGCESWLVEQLSVEEFESFGFGDFIMFLERYLHLLPDALQKFLIGHNYEYLPFEPCMLQLQLDVLMSQASNNIWKNEKVSMIMVLGLLGAQFPSACFKSVKNDSLLDLEDILRENEGNLTAKCVLFSATLLKKHSVGGFSALNENLLDSGGSELDIGHNAGSPCVVTTKDAIEVLLRAPMLTDLHIWAHWDTNYAPSLGSLVAWLLNEVNARELLCLVTKDGKVMRLDHTATMESFLDVLLEGSCFGTAVKLLSLLALYGGEGNVPLSLLKCHAQKAFEVIIKNSMEKEFHGDQGCLVQGVSMPGHDVFERNTSRNIDDGFYRDRNRVNEVVQVISGFILDCLGYLPAEFWSFATTVLFAGLQNLIKDAPSAILAACKKVEQRVRLHEVGLSLGILEWIDDYHQFSTSALTNSILTFDSSCSKDASYEYDRGILFPRNRLKDDLPSLGGKEVLIKSNQNNDHQEVNSMEQVADVPVHHSLLDTAPRLCKPDCIHDPLGVVDSIRRDEFGLDPSLSTTESRTLMKQHARLGRALHCLSHELYSQDSHFLLELVQNADDNTYPENVEPSLSFIVQEKGIVVLNNEIGFSAENVRALCDVGNSTKRGLNTGYIGKKGIGFKSVFRVTDAPEIHSNGFHIKFDITEGQIGFVLPTIVPPCDIESYSKLLSTNTDDMDCNSWRTCIVLPFKATLSQGLVMNSISMFSDLHASLLLFLHRLQCIKLRNMLDNSLTVMRKEVTGDGIVKVSMGKEKMVWLVASKKLQADNIRHDVNETEISIAFSLEEANNGEYIPQLQQQPVFSFLPLRTYGLKFIVQGDFVLPSSREEVVGDSPWNQWLLSEIPELFVAAQKSFCDLACFRENAAKAVTAFMSFVPFVGEVQGFFSSLPRLIISKLRMSNCLLLEADRIEWVPPCKVLRNWNEQARVLLPNWLLRKHLGLGFLKKDIILSDSLARALGIEEYGPRTLFHVVSSLSRSENGLKDMGLGWLSIWINEVHLMSLNSGTESDLILSLRKVPFIPLSDGKYGLVDSGTIWLHCDTIGVGNEYDFKAFPKLYSKLRIVNPALFSAAAAAADKSCSDASIVENITRMLIKVGVQRLSAHEIVKMHILPSISDDRTISRDKDLLTDYLAFILLHLQSSCPRCCLERDWIMSHLRTEALVLTNYGYKRLNEVPIHFSKEFRNPIDMNKLINGIDMIWLELDSIYLKHPITKSVPDGILKWRNFFQELGITDFVQIVQIEKPVANVSLTSMGPTAKDWESWELGHMLSQLSSSGDSEKCKYLLEIIDTLWDDYFCDKVTSCCIIPSCEAGKPVESSIISMLQNAKWMVSIMDDDLHYPRDLFLDCEAVRSIIGATAPYAVPKVRSQKLLDALNLKSQVRIDDILLLLKVWRTAAPFKTSIAQMSRLYTFIWGEMAKSKPKIVEELSSGPFIFFPHVSGFSREDDVTGVFLSSKEVCWHDTTGSMDQMKLLHPKFASDMTGLPCIKILSSVYPALHDFFVNECGVEELPPINGYLRILIELSTTALPSQVARTVFNVFSEWADRLNCGLLSNEDVEYLRGRFVEKECSVFPTAQDKWVSLHPSFGLICWSDDDELRKEFKYLDGIDMLNFGNLMDEDIELLQTKVANLMRMLGIPALSAVVSREAIYYGPTDSSLKASLVNWVLPYAQRYIYHVHPDKYLQLKNCGFENVRCLQIVVVEKLFYRNVVKRREVVSKKRFECTCLLQDNILYATPESDSHSIFMELSRVLFDDAPQLHLANFLHMITTMAEAGSSEEQTEFFILNSQKVPKLPEGETIWSLSSLSGIVNDELHTSSTVSALVDKSNTYTNKRKLGINSNWPPVGWKTAPSSNFACSIASKTQAGDSLPIREVEDAEVVAIETGQMALANLNSDLAFQGGQSSILPTVHLKFQDVPSSTTPEACLQYQDGPSSTAPEACVQIQDGPSGTTPGVCLQNTVIPEDQPDHASIMAASSSAMVFDSVDAPNASDGPHFAFSDSGLRNKLFWGNTGAQAALTGRLGEFVAFKYFAARVGEPSVKWVNETSETGLPYDLLIGNEENGWEYVEVKATKSRSATRDLAFISVREWQFAFEKGESFSIAHVILLDDNTARVTTYKNPVKLCQLGKLRFAVIMPRELELSNLC